MNKLFLPLLLVLAMLASCTKAPDPAIYLRSVTSYMTPYENGQPKPAARFKWGSESYDSQGLLYKKEYRASDRPQEMYNTLHWEIYVYQHGRLNDVSFYHTPNQIGSNGFYQRYEYFYTAERVSEKKIYNERGLFATFAYSYDGGNKPSQMEIIYSGESNSLDTRRIYTYTYDQRGNLVKEVLNSSDFYTKITQWEYDARGNLTKQSTSDTYDSTIVVHEEYYYTYDTKGRIKEREFSRRGYMHFQKWVYHYDDSDRGASDHIKTIEVFQETTPGNRIYQLAGVIDYSYDYGTL